MQTVPFLQACSVAPLLSIFPFLLSAQTEDLEVAMRVFSQDLILALVYYFQTVSHLSKWVSPCLCLQRKSITFSVHPSSCVLYTVPLPTDFQATRCPRWSHAIPPHLQTLACGRCSVKKHPLNSSFALKIPCWFRVCVKLGQDCLNSPWFGCSRDASVRCFKSS